MSGNEHKIKEKNYVCVACEKEAEDLTMYNKMMCCCACIPKKDDFVEGVVCHSNDIKENEMKLLALGENEGKILLIKQKGELHAIGTKCPHYGALLHTGALGNGRVRCPWHGACFNIKTGDIEDYPGLNALPCHEVNIDESGLVHVKAKRRELESNKRIKEMCEFNVKNTTTAIIVGGGPAGATCAESLRQEGFTGKIIMICMEKILPYDRVKVSKTLDLDPEKVLLRPQVFYDNHNIITKLGIEATGLDTNQNIITLSNKEKLKYDYLFICTGSKPRMPNIDGIETTSNIFSLRYYSDAHAINSQLSSDKNIVILGTGFIGMEAAAYCVNKCASVTIIGRDNIPFKAVFGDKVGARIKEEFEKKNVKFIFESNIVKFIAKKDTEKSGKKKKEKTKRIEKFPLESVQLADGTILPADIAIIGIGTTFNTEWLKDSSIQLQDNGSVVADKCLRTNVKNIYVGGDLAHAPIFGSDDICTTIGHYSLAQYHGKIAALNICGKESPLNAVPFFWTTLFGKSYRYSGYGRASEIQIFGDLKNLEYFAYYLAAGKVIAMSSVGADPIVSDFANLQYEGKFLSEEEISMNPFKWIRNKPKDMEKRFRKFSDED